MRKPRPKGDENQGAAHAVSQTIAKHETPLPPGIEAAWEAWSRGVGKVDERGMALLGAAFEVGVAAAKAVTNNSQNPKIEILCNFIMTLRPIDSARAMKKIFFHGVSR